MAITALDRPEGAIDALGDGIGFVALVDRMEQDPALKVVNSARISYDKQKEGFEDKDRKLCSFLWEHGHTSPFRHSFFTFHWSWNEVSGRYVRWTPEFYVPTVMRANPPHGNKQASFDLPEDFDHAGERKLMLAECEDAFKRYEARIERGVAKEIARMILPQSLYTQAYWTVSLQGVLHFLQQRLKPDAQYEIRVFAEAVRDLVKDDLARVGVTFEDA